LEALQKTLKDVSLIFDKPLESSFVGKISKHAKSKVEVTNSNETLAKSMSLFFLMSSLWLL